MTGGTWGGHLPQQLTSFVGRRREMSEVKRLLSTARLVTLTGVGGVGKTRLALRVAEESRRGFPAGVWVVELDQVRDGALTAQTVVASLDLHEQAGRSPVEVLTEYLAGRHLLLILDNCEHLVGEVAKVADRLIRAAPGLRVLATSREPLGVDGEATLVVPPLSVPEPGRAVPLPDLSRYEAVSLFAERAASVLPGFEITEANRAAVADTCHLVEGLPLAIELAAARLRVLAPEQLRDRLSDRLALLTRGSRVAPTRQQTLRACVEWSYDLCTRAERRLWARLSVFAGGFGLDALDDVCAGGELATDDLEALVTTLTEKSIITTERGRYRMLETLRDYGAERLVELAEADRVARRHRDHYAALAARAAAAWVGPDQLAWFRTLNREHANLQAAIEYGLREPETAQELAANLWFFWIACGFLREGRYYLERALASGGTGRAHRRALWACAFVTGSQGDLDVAEALVRQCRAEATAAGDTRLETYAMETYAMILAIRGELDAAVHHMRACAAYYRTLDELDAGLLRTLPMLGVTLVMRGDPDAALELAPECQELCARLGERWQRSYVDHFVGLALRGKGEPARAAARLSAAIATKHQFHDIVGLVLCVEPLAGATAELGDGARAARLLGIAEGLRQAFGLPDVGSRFHVAERRRAEERARALPPPPHFEREWRAGCALDLDEAVAYALASPPDRGPLTPREREVAALVGQGLTNREIAGRLVISTRTAESHVHHILTKLGFVRRAQLAAWIAGQEPD
ncbi:LuxR C-terminal-related transcriptional regulator [Actinomycetes bacterium KLBMP 9797]